MRKLLTLFAVGAFVSLASADFTPTFDGILDEWGGTLNLGTEPGIDAGNYTLLTGWDATNLYFGMDRDSTDRYLGDTGGDNDSFFVAIDVDGIAASGANQDGYARMDFGGSMLPDVIYYFTGNGGWYEWNSWNGASWDWQGWSDSGTYYGYQEDNPDDELTIPLANIGGSEEVMVWAWMTREGNTNVEASWPTGYTGDEPNPVFGDGIAIPEPMTLAGLLIGLALLRRR